MDAGEVLAIAHNIRTNGTMAASALCSLAAEQRAILNLLNDYDDTYDRPDDRDAHRTLSQIRLIIEAGV